MKQRTPLTSLIGLAMMALAGCGDRPDGESSEVQVLEAVSPNAGTAFQFFVSKGLADFQAAGIVGNLEIESGVDPNSRQLGGGPGRGIAQWSVGGRWDRDPQDNVVWFARSRGASEWSLELQLEFVWYELTTFPAFGLAELRATTSVEAATATFSKRFERCGDCHDDRRIARAREALAAFGRAAVNAHGCTQPEEDACARFATQCVDHQCSGGFGEGHGCTQSEEQACARFGTQCVDHGCSGGFGEGHGCTAREERDCASFGTQCVDHQCSGGFGKGHGCTAREERDCASVATQCVDHQCSGGLGGRGTGCTAREQLDCDARGMGCYDHACTAR